MPLTLAFTAPWTATRSPAPSAPAPSAAGRSAAPNRTFRVAWAGSGRGGIAMHRGCSCAVTPPTPADKSARILQGVVASELRTCSHHERTGARPPSCNDPAHSPPHHHLSLQAAGVVRGASHDVPPARQLRPEAARGLAHDQARARDHALGARRVRQLRDDCRFSRAAGRGAAVREQHLAGSRAVECARTSRSRTTRRNIRSPMRPRR